jgi:hypothetical protein
VCRKTPERVASCRSTSRGAYAVTP